MDESAPLPWQQAAWQRISGTRVSGRLPHALLLVGPDGVGKSHFASCLAKALECASVNANGEACGRCQPCQLTFAGNHPDLIWVRPEADERTIKIDAVRRLSEQSILTPEGLGYRVLVVEPADAMTYGAANALLKTLEEPAPRTILLLISSQPARLPATIRSRCQRLALPVPERASALAWLGAQSDHEFADCALSLAAGAPLKALEFIRQGVLKQVAQLAHDLRQVVLGDAGPVAVAAQWQKFSTEFTLGYLQQWTVDLIRLKHNKNPPLLFHAGLENELFPIIAMVKPRRLFGLLTQLTELRRRREHNLNPLLSIEKILIICSSLRSAERPI